MYRSHRQLQVHGGVRWLAGNATGDATSSTQNVGENGKKGGSGWGILSTRSITRCNFFVGLLHGVWFVTFWILAANKSEKTVFYIQRDAIQYTPSNVWAPVYNPDPTNSTICYLAAPEMFRVRDKPPLMLTWYPQSTGASIHLHSLVIAFFGLSFFFQIVWVHVLYPLWYLLLRHRLPGLVKRILKKFLGIATGSSDAHPSTLHGHWVWYWMFYEDLFGYQFDETSQSRLLFNCYRFVEYTFSATVMVLALCLTFGIRDQESLTYTGALCAACMIVGLIAEWLFVLSERLESNSDQSNGVRHSLRSCAWWSHCLAWVLIVIPFFFIIMRIVRLYNDPVGSCNTEHVRGPNTPWELLAIFIPLVFFFLCFGFVQLGRFTRLLSAQAQELFYIILSFSAKTFLAWTLGFYVLMF